MIVIAACAVLVLAGVAIVVRIGGDPPAEPREPGLRSLARYLALTAAAGAAAGVLAAGAGGRLIMRLLALTAPEAEGSLTEAEQIVGEISVEGTLGFLAFAGLSAGLITAMLYVLLRPILPPGRTGGAVLGAVALLLVGTRVEPLRPGNFDFNIVGPTWLSVLSFTALAVFQGMVTTALAAPVPGPPALTGRALAGVRIGLAVAMLALLPSFVSAVSDIVG
jgi:hypothetical protein